MTMEKKQSSVDWFFQQIRNNGGGFTAEDLFEWHKQAKVMHGEEIINAYKREACYMKYVGCTDEQINKSSEKYYNENFKSE